MTHKTQGKYYMNAPRKLPPEYTKVWDFTPPNPPTQKVLQAFRVALEHLIIEDGADETGDETENTPNLSLRTELQANATIRGLADFIIWAANELATNAAKYTGTLTAAETPIYTDEHGGFRGAELGYVNEESKAPSEYDIILLIHDSSPDDASGQPDRTRPSYEGRGYGTVAIYEEVATDHGSTMSPDGVGKTVWVRFSANGNADA